MPRETQSTVALTAGERELLEGAKHHFEQKAGRQLTLGEFIGVLAAGYLTAFGMTGERLGGITSGNISVSCIFCGGQISWPPNLAQAYCPYCGRLLRLVPKGVS